VKITYGRFNYSLAQLLKFINLISGLYMYVYIYIERASQVSVHLVPVGERRPAAKPLLNVDFTQIERGSKSEVKVNKLMRKTLAKVLHTKK